MWHPCTFSSPQQALAVIVTSTDPSSLLLTSALLCTPCEGQQDSSSCRSAAISIAAAELPVQSDQEAAADAELLLAAVQSADAPDWTLALALLLDDRPAIAGNPHAHHLPSSALSTASCTLQGTCK